MNDLDQITTILRRLQDPDLDEHTREHLSETAVSLVVQGMDQRTRDLDSEVVGRVMIHVARFCYAVPDEQLGATLGTILISAGGRLPLRDLTPDDKC